MTKKKSKKTQKKKTTKKKNKKQLYNMSSAYSLQPGGNGHIFYSDLNMPNNK